MSDSTNSGDSYSLDTVYQTLLNRRRRLVLHYLRTVPNGVSNFDSVTDQIMDWNTSADEASESVDESELVASLHHVHLPKLDEYGIIDYDSRTRTIRYHPSDVLEAHLDLAARYDLDD